ncbi:MAG: hypothetical protein IBX69_14850 [Anaerolineales bacterium]|nr:hypothetical protein [Anaerolineales bacterium]
MIDLHQPFVLLFILGILALSLGAEFFVKGTARLTAFLGVSPLVLGLTVVAFGTSAPEVAVVLEAGFSGRGDLAFGNIVGSNISNFLLILGISAVTAPLVVSQRLIKIEVPLLLVVSIIVLVMGIDGQINWLEGSILLVGVMIYTVLVLRKMRVDNKSAPHKNIHANTKKKAPSPKDSRRQAAWLKSAFLLLAGLIGLVIGAGWLVSGATGIARILGVSELVIGLTVVAVGTSLPLHLYR